MTPDCMNRCYLLTGGNMGNSADYLTEARRRIEEDCGCIIESSSVYKTAAWGVEDQPPFLNQVLAVDTPLNAAELLRRILSIEQTMGRQRAVKYGPRMIDIDVLFFNSTLR